MPVRSLRSSILTWPDARQVGQAVRQWAAHLAATVPDIVEIGYFGSYGRGDWGPGSDVDVIVIVRASDQPFERRASRYDATDLPVAADVLVYTREEWQQLAAHGGRFYQTVMRDAIWVYRVDA